MPLRIPSLRASVLSPCPHAPPPPPSASARQLFHRSPNCRDASDGMTHYDILKVQPNATADEIKKSFYALSKIHHPDHNTSDPLASNRFMRLSEAYCVLSNTDRRAAYDRHVLPVHSQPADAARASAGRRSNSTGPAGARPASGLSRRRGSFQGPPPSFYRSGGWGAHAAQRGASHEESTGRGRGTGAGSSTSYYYQQQQQQQQQQQARSGSPHTGFRTGGMGPGHEPFGRGPASRTNDMPHFDRSAQAAHTRTQARIDDRRARRQARHFPLPSHEQIKGKLDFLLVLGVLATGAAFPFFFMARPRTTT